MRQNAELKAQQLIDQGIAYHRDGKIKKAIDCFRKAWQTAPLPQALNNWASVLWEKGKAAEALEVLEPLRKVAGLLPYTHALASLCHSALGQTEEARRELGLAIRDFDAGNRWRGGSLGEDSSWTEYTALIKLAAGFLGDHRLVLDLHSRWPGRELPQGAFAAGVAAFNLGKYAQARRIWGRVRDLAWAQPLAGHCLVAEQAERGLVPPFELEYRGLDPEEIKGLPDEEAASLPERGAVRMLMLAAMFEQARQGEDAQATTTARELIAHTGEWGIELGRRLLSGFSVAMSLKMGAAEALIEAGIYQPGEPIPIVHQGRRTEIRLAKMEVVQGEQPELQAIMEEAQRLWQEGRREEALARLADLRERSIAYPPAMQLEAWMLREQRQFEPALALLQSLEQIAPDAPFIQYQLALLHAQRGDAEKALRHVEAIDLKEVPPDFRRQVKRLKEWAQAVVFVPDLDDILEVMREEADEKPIQPDLRLATALRRIPVQWLNAAAAVHAIPYYRRRPEREKALAEVLRDPERLRAALAAERPDVRAALSFLLEQGGWTKLQRLTRRFGSMEGDGFYWDEDPPTSTLGRLRLLGLLYVGRATVDGRRHLIGVIPTELRPLLAQVI